MIDETICVYYLLSDEWRKDNVKIARLMQKPGPSVSSQNFRAQQPGAGGSSQFHTTRSTAGDHAVTLTRPSPRRKRPRRESIFSTSSSIPRVPPLPNRGELCGPNLVG